MSTADAFNKFIETFVDGEGEHKYLMLRRLCEGDPNRKFVVDFTDIYNHDPELAQEFIDHPKQTIENTIQTTQQGNISVHVSNLTDSIPLRQINSNHIGKLIQIHGIVTKSHPSASKIVVAAFKCQSCGEINLVTQNTQFLITPPKCSKCKHKKFDIDFSETKYIDYQQIYVQESPDQLPPGETPLNMRVILEKDIVKSANPGDRVNIIGVISVSQSRPGSHKLELNRHTQANYVSVVNRETDLLSLTEKEIEEMKAFAQRDDLFVTIARNIAPDIHGMLFSKKAIALQLTGGRTDGERVLFLSRRCSRSSRRRSRNRKI